MKEIWGCLKLWRCFFRIPELERAALVWVPSALLSLPGISALSTAGLCCSVLYSEALADFALSDIDNGWALFPSPVASRTQREHRGASSYWIPLQLSDRCPGKRC